MPGLGLRHRFVLMLREGRRAYSECGCCYERNAADHSGALLFAAAEQFDQFRRLLALLGDIAGDDRVFDAMVEMVLQEVRFHARERGANGAQLREDIEAIALVLDHLRDTAHLPFDAAQAIDQVRSVMHAAAYIPPWGICNRRGRNSFRG